LHIYFYALDPFALGMSQPEEDRHARVTVVHMNCSVVNQNRKWSG
jgi:hypothetical protein